MVPSHSRRSVPALMPVNSTCTSTSASPMAGSAKALSARDLGFSKTIAWACMAGLIYKDFVNQWTAAALAFVRDLRPTKIWVCSGMGLGTASTCVNPASVIMAMSSLADRKRPAPMANR